MPRYGWNKFEWDDEGRKNGNVQHLRDHGIEPDEAEECFFHGGEFENIKLCELCASAVNTPLLFRVPFVLFVTFVVKSPFLLRLQGSRSGSLIKGIGWHGFSPAGS